MSNKEDQEFLEAAEKTFQELQRTWNLIHSLLAYEDSGIRGAIDSAEKSVENLRQIYDKRIVE